jgi:hypothetical protein
LICNLSMLQSRRTGDSNSCGAGGSKEMRCNLSVIEGWAAVHWSMRLRPTAFGEDAALGCIGRCFVGLGSRAMDNALAGRSVLRGHGVDSTKNRIKNQGSNFRTF